MALVTHIGLVVAILVALLVGVMALSAVLELLLLVAAWARAQRRRYEGSQGR